MFQVGFKQFVTANRTGCALMTYLYHSHIPAKAGYYLSQHNIGEVTQETARGHARNRYYPVAGNT